MSQPSGWLHTAVVYLQMVTHLSTNRALRSVTLLMWLLPLSLGQTATHSFTANTNPVLH